MLYMTHWFPVGIELIGEDNSILNRSKKTFKLNSKRALDILKEIEKIAKSQD